MLGVFKYRTESKDGKKGKLFHILNMGRRTSYFTYYIWEKDKLETRNIEEKVG